MNTCSFELKPILPYGRYEIGEKNRGKRIKRPSSSWVYLDFVTDGVQGPLPKGREKDCRGSHGALGKLGCLLSDTKKRGANELNLGSAEERGWKEARYLHSRVYAIPSIPNSGYLIRGGLLKDVTSETAEEKGGR